MNGNQNNAFPLPQKRLTIFQRIFPAPRRSLQDAKVPTGTGFWRQRQVNGDQLPTGNGPPPWMIFHGFSRLRFDPKPGMIIAFWWLDTMLFPKIHKGNGNLTIELIKRPLTYRDDGWYHVVSCPVEYTVYDQYIQGEAPQLFLLVYEPRIPTGAGSRHHLCWSCVAALTKEVSWCSISGDTFPFVNF